MGRGMYDTHTCDAPMPARLIVLPDLTCTLAGTFVAGTAEDCRYAEKSCPHKI